MNAIEEISFNTKMFDYTEDYNEADLTDDDFYKDLYESDWTDEEEIVLQRPHMIQLIKNRIKDKDSNRVIRNIVLDIDHTLLHAVDRRIDQVSDSAFCYFDVKKYQHLDVFERPYLQHFLDYLFDNYNVGIFTAGHEYYGDFVCENIIMNEQRTPAFLLHREHFDECQEIFHTYKDLKYVEQLYPEFKASETIIIDDYDCVRDTNGLHCIHIKEFNLLDHSMATSLSDDVLIDVLSQIKDRDIKIDFCNNRTSREEC